MAKAKPFNIPKREVWEAFKKVKANQGAAGVDGQTIAEFEADLSNNLYRLWNRMSSGSYFPPPVRRVQAVWHGSRYGTSFLPAASPKALKAIRQTIRRWALHHRTDKSLADLARMFRPYIQGWINYYSHFYKSELTPTLQRIDAFLLRWARNKFKRLRQRPKGARDWLARVVRATPYLFAHWRFLHANGRTSGAV